MVLIPFKNGARVKRDGAVGCRALAGLNPLQKRGTRETIDLKYGYRPVES